LFEAFDRPKRGAMCIFPLHAGGDVFFNLPLHVIPQLFVEFLLDRRARKE
jgi:esterase/lipase superfamily enzyme